MLLQIKGKPYKIVDPLVGRITYTTKNLNSSSMLIYHEGIEVNSNFRSALSILTTQKEVLNDTNLPQIYALPSTEHLEEGDLVSIESSGIVRTLYRNNSVHNSILVTEMCNSKCLMCSQPPKGKNDITYLNNINLKLIPLIRKSCSELTITGGEPTLLKNKLFNLIRAISNQLSETELYILTNGRKFAWYDFTRDLENIDTNKIVFGIPLYSDYYALHDFIVQSKNAFNQTMVGLHNLARLDQRIEIRIVLHKLTIRRLEKLTRFIYKNLPFVEHVALMGLENTGFTPYNISELWIDPYDYREELKNAALFLDSVNMNVSIYNLQLCILPIELWQFARKSISEWKNIYIEQCDHCKIKNQCGGFFESCSDIHSKFIRPFISDPKEIS